MGFHAATHLPETTKELTHQLAFFICLRRGDGLRLNAPDKHGPVIPTPQRREEDLTNIRLKIAFISDHCRRPQQRQDLFETVVCSCMHTHERFVLLHALADFFKSEMPTAKSILSSTCCRPPPSKNEARPIFSASIAVILPA